MTNGFTVVIPTYNRAGLIGRAIQSVLNQRAEPEIIVIDNASTDNTPEVVKSLYPQVRYLRQEVNQGPGPARNRGIHEASGRWVVMLDDDDTLLPHALTDILTSIESFPDSGKYPVLQFAHSNGSIPESFVIVDLDFYIRCLIKGDFVPVIQAPLFLELSLAYPDFRIGAEHLLWWQIAERYGIPTWANMVAHVHNDAPARLTSFEQQIKYAREHALVQEITLNQFGMVLKEQAPALYQKKQIGAITYWLLAGESELARLRLRQNNSDLGALLVSALWMLSLLPHGVICSFFVAFRRLGIR